MKDKDRLAVALWEADRHLDTLEALYRRWRGRLDAEASA